VLIGHLFPVWLNFKGGKGVAVYVGVMLALSPLTGLFAIGAWIVAALVSRKSSLAALAMIVLVLPLLFLLGEYTSAYVAIVMGALIFRAHRENIARLRDGSEPKIFA
ncbi:MAG: glycerol-3-phosphate acyltransferase, partial [Alphaproteobacteria bacterium]|nr:glycerol-3-phosphate acyltransferase [Alphaproteobacteria bacterium]